jgi:inner membrane protein
MDVFTQGVLGGVLAQSAARTEEKKLATFAGVASGLLADADILISSTADPLLTIEYHRHFTHSLLFIPVGAAIAWLLLWALFYRRIAAGRLYLFCLLGFSMSGLLDACTSYGTHLLWPFSDERVSFNIISIIDPLFTLILFVTLVWGLRSAGRRVVAGGLLLCAAYLSLGFVQLQRAQDVAYELAQSRGHALSAHVVKPTIANLVLWRSVYIAAGEIHVDAVRVGLGKPQVFKGDSVPRFDAARDLPGLDPASVLRGDIQRFSEFSAGFVAFDPAQPNVLGDIRYSMLPTSTRPLWGIAIDADKPGQHADYRFFRDASKDVRQAFIDMVMGKPMKRTDQFRK